MIEDGRARFDREIDAADRCVRVVGGIVVRGVFSRVDRHTRTQTAHDADGDRDAFGF